MIKTILIILCIAHISLPQKKQVSDNKLNYTFNFPNKHCSLLLEGYKNHEDSQFIYASEFTIVDMRNNNTLIFFGALQSCKIDKNKKDSLSIIETKRLPLDHSGKWKDINYLEYNLILKSNKVFIDTLLLLDISKIPKMNKTRIIRDFGNAKNHTAKVSEELSYYILFLALRNDSWAKDKLFTMKDELNLDGDIAEINQDATNIYRSYNRLK
jgi:hypothetical protein